MFGTTHVEVDRHPVLFQFLSEEGIAIASVDVAEVIPARTSPLRHGVRFADTLAAVLIDDLEPFGSVRERRLTAVTRLVVLEFRQEHRKFSVVHRRDFAIFPVDNREIIFLLGVPRTSCGSGYILGAVVIASLAARRLKRHHSTAPRGHYP